MSSSFGSGCLTSPKVFVRPTASVDLWDDDLLPIFGPGTGVSEAESGPSDGEASPRTHHPVVEGAGPLGQAMASLEMLACYYNVPFRRDVVHERRERLLVSRPRPWSNSET